LQVDCTQESDLCRQHYITGFPSIRVFRKGHDDIYLAGAETGPAQEAAMAAQLCKSTC